MLKSDFNRLLKRTIAPLLAFALLLPGCASVPKESVELSYMLGTDLEALHQSYRSLIRSYFDALRGDINTAVDNVFVPAYINDFAASGKLADKAKAGRADLVQLWAKIAVETIEAERRKRLEPIDAAERQLLLSVDDAFARTLRTNAAITAHLSSVRDVGEAQDEVLAALELKELRNRIDGALADASRQAKAISGAINATNAGLQQLESTIKP